MTTPYTRRASWQDSSERLAEWGIRQLHDPGQRQRRRIYGRNGPQIAHLELRARTALLMAFRTAAPDAGLRPLEQLAEVLDGAPATLPSPQLSPQCLVEATSLSYALLLTKESYFLGLPEATKSAWRAWLFSTLDNPIPDNNWHHFRNAIVENSVALGGEPEPRHLRMQRDSQHRLEDFYHGGGWFRDGLTGNFDYYNSFSFHYYPTLSAIVHQRPLTSQSLTRLADYCSDLAYLISERGAPLIHGRSLTYRTAICAALAMQSLADPNPERNARNGTICGAVHGFFSTSIPSGSSELEIGWLGKNLDFRQPYSGYGSPLWIAKSYACLMLEEDDPFWHAPPPNPPARATRRIALNAGIAAKSSPSGGVRYFPGDARIGEGKHRHIADDPFYTRNSYSSSTLPTSGRYPSNTIARRGIFHTWRIGDRFTTSIGDDWIACEAHVFRERRFHPSEMLGRNVDLRRFARNAARVVRQDQAAAQILTLALACCEVTAVAWRQNTAPFAPTFELSGWPCDNPTEAADCLALLDAVAQDGDSTRAETRQGVRARRARQGGVERNDVWVPTVRVLARGALAVFAYRTSLTPREHTCSAADAALAVDSDGCVRLALRGAKRQFVLPAAGTWREIA